MIMDWLCDFVMGKIWVFLFREEMGFMELGFGIVSLGFIGYWAALINIDDSLQVMYDTTEVKLHVCC